jgi:nucleoside-diphosphate-sugar epimerase
VRHTVRQGILIPEMNLLLIGGSGFIGPHVARRLVKQGHNVASFQRRPSPNLPPDVLQVFGSHEELSTVLPQFRRFAPDVVIQFILSSERQAKSLMPALRGITARVVALSSGDVYRAAGILHGLESGGLQSVPLTEESELRTHLHPYPPEALARVRKVYPWVDDDYDKIPVEQIVMNDPHIAGTILRLPMVYGPGDPLHRLHPMLKRIDDARPAILLEEEAAQWRGPRGYVENVAAAIALAATSPHAAGRIYNIAEPQSFSELEWTQQVARATGWKGEVLAVPKQHTPAHLQIPYNAAQHWTMSSTRIRQELGYIESVPLDAALDRTIAWERANPPAEIDPKQFDYDAENAALATRASA